MITNSPPEDRRPPITPQLALRVAVLGGFALVMFALIFFRLWYLEVLSGDQYVGQANDNRVREVGIQAPRGDVVDRNGTPIVTSRQATVVQVSPAKLPAPGPRRTALYVRLGHVLGERPARIQAQVIAQRKVLPYAAATVKTDVPRSVLNYLNERSAEFPGVSTPAIFLRQYPFHQTAAHLLGNVGQISPAELRQEHFRGVSRGTVVGQGGIEYEYDRYLRGRDGAQVLQVDSIGKRKGLLRVREPIPGRQLKLSLDLGLQRAAQDALVRAGGGKPGGFVAMDPRNGQVYALGSFPTYDPSIFTKPISQSVFDKLNSQANGAPLYDRAVAGLYPTGSTFKPITAMAALTSGIITPDTPISDGGCLKVGVQKFCNAGGVVNGTLSLRRAIQVSSDVFFYTLGEEANAKGTIVQQWARKLGLGERTGIDLPGEFRGLIPDPAWRARVVRREFACRKRRHVPSCGISDGRPWSVGDNINLAVGQGDVQATPLQMATVYATLENGGKVVRPHLGLAVEDSQGRLVQQIDPPAARHVHLDSTYRQAILDGLHAATSQAGGTSADVFTGWDQTRYPAYGKTGTAERPPHPDQSWYVCFVPDKTHPIVVAVTIEGGGFGAQTAAPAARLILSKWFNQKAKYVAGHSHTR